MFCKKIVFGFQICYAINTANNTSKRRANMEPKYPNITVKLVGKDGNAFAIMGRVREALSKGGASKEEIHEYLEQSRSGDYDHLLQVAMQWVNVE